MDIEKERKILNTRKDIFIMKANFYFENNNAGNIILINVGKRWFVDDGAPGGKWCGIDLYERTDDYSVEESCSPAIEKLRDFLASYDNQTEYEFSCDYIEHLEEIEEFCGKTAEEVEESENDDGHGTRRNHDNSTIVFIGECDVNLEYDEEEEDYE